MKTLLTVTILISAAAFAQSDKSILNNSGVKKQPPQTVAGAALTTQMIANLMASPKPINSLNVPRLHRMGDGAAARVLQILKTRGPLSASEQHNVVQIVHKSFEKPSAIMTPANRTMPVASLALLDQVSAGTQDFALKLEIADAKQFVQDASSSGKP